MNIATNPIPDQTMPREMNAQSNWYRLYFVLAAFNILTVCISLFMNHQLRSMHESSVETNSIWAKRLVALADINALATQTNAPGNDVFESKKPDEAEIVLYAKLSMFNIALEHARQELRTNLPQEEASSLLPFLDQAEEAMRLQVLEAQYIFDHIRTNNMTDAGKRMAAMDHAYYVVTGAIRSLGLAIQNRQQKELVDQDSAATAMRNYEYIIAAMIVVMVALAWLYGYRLSERAKKTDTHTQTLIKKIEMTNLELEGQKEEAEAMNAELREINNNLETARLEATMATKAKSDFLANMSHEIRTPMTAILGFTDTLREEGDLALAPKQRIEAIDIIHRNGQYLVGIINDILDLSKVEAGQMTTERIAFKPCELLAEVIELMRIRADAKGLNFDIEYIGAIPETIESDPIRLRQILINLIGNAIKFTEIGSVKLITSFVQKDKDDKELHPKNSYMQFDVLDTGQGMNNKQSAMLFKPFSQADTSTTRKFGGTGLGLTISKRFAEILGGDIILIDSTVGVGTQFRATIEAELYDGAKLLDNPMLVTEVATAADHVVHILPTDLQGVRILLAEDGLDNQRLISFVLNKAGANVSVENNGKLAMDAALAARENDKPFDCILMDMQMPVMDGYEATKQLRIHCYTGPIIALTAHAMDGDRKKCIDAGCNDYLTKPIDRKLLIESIQQLLVPNQTTILSLT